MREMVERTLESLGRNLEIRGRTCAMAAEARTERTTDLSSRRSAETENDGERRVIVIIIIIIACHLFHRGRRPSVSIVVYHWQNEYISNSPCQPNRLYPSLMFFFEHRAF